MTSQDLAEDADLTVNDAERILAGILEIAELHRAGRITSYDVTDIARDVIPRLAAVQAYLIEQCAEVTA